MSDNLKFEIQSNLKRLSATDNSIKDTAKLIAPHKAKVLEIVQILKDEVKECGTNQDKILLIIYLIHEIIAETRDNTTDFLAQLGYSLKEIITTFCQVATNQQNLENVLGIITIWEKQMVYASTFVDKLRKIIIEKANIIGVTNIVAKQDNNLQKHSGNESQYNRAMIRDYKLIQSNSLTKQLYNIRLMEENITKKNEDLKKIVNIDNISSLLQTENVNESISHAKNNLLEMKEILLKIVEEYGEAYKKCIKNCETEMKEWTNFDLNTYESFKSQLEIIMNQIKSQN